MLKILLVEDNPSECLAITNIVERFDDITLVAATNTASIALQKAQDCLPDVIILDLELHNGGGNGPQFLKELRRINPKPSPYILVTTHNTSAVTHASTRELGADFVLVKSQEDYSAENVIEFLRALKNTILNAQNRARDGQSDGDAPNELRKRMYTRVSSELERIGISPKATGRKYIIDAILLVYDGLPHGICAAIGEKYDKSDSSVERAMQNAINAAWRRTDIEALQKHYTAWIRSSRGVPTITEFLHYYANKLKTEYGF